MKDKLEQLIKKAVQELGLPESDFTVEHPADLSHGDYSTNVAMVLAKSASANPKELAENILRYIVVTMPEYIEKVEVAGPGFINFYLSKEFFKQSIGEIISNGENYGKSTRLTGQKVIIEYTDPNPFKEFHIGHLMSNSIGEAISRLVEWNGAEVKRACYQGDVGMHVAKALWALMNNEQLSISNVQEVAEAYSIGAKAFDENEEAKKEIQEINKKIYDRSDDKVNEVYDKGRKASLEYFDEIYKKLGTKFDFFFFESETADTGKKIVEDNIGKVFEESDGAIVFKAENYNPKLHTRVFINSEGLPTYEAKELGLAPMKFDKYSYDKSIVITGNEVNDYFKVLLEALNQIFPELAKKTLHISHGMLRLPTGKMSSRTGDVTTAEELIKEVKETIKAQGKEETDEIAVGALKYMILRQAMGNDIIFDFEKSVSTEGDSGPYLQYAYARTNSLLQKAGKRGDATSPREKMHELEKLLYRFPEIIERSMEDYSPNILVTYLTEIVGSFSNLYAAEQIISNTPESPYLLALTEAFNIVLRNGLTVLAIPTPERM